LRGIASGLDVSYAYLANDLTDVNYSSIRAGVLDERDVWRDVQAFMAEHVLQPIFEEWLEMALLTQKINLPFSKLEKFKKARWQPRGWQWVDPEKDVNAKIMSIENNLETGADIAAEQGKDLEEIYQQLAIEKELKKKYGLMPQPVKTAKNGKPVAVET
jgi:lambda family phage portal protein